MKRSGSESENNNPQTDDQNVNLPSTTAAAAVPPESPQSSLSVSDRPQQQQEHLQGRPVVAASAAQPPRPYPPMEINVEHSEASVEALTSEVEALALDISTMTESQRRQDQALAENEALAAVTAPNNVQETSDSSEADSEVLSAPSLDLKRSSDFVIPEAFMTDEYLRRVSKGEYSVSEVMLDDNGDEFVDAIEGTTTSATPDADTHHAEAEAERIAALAQEQLQAAQQAAAQAEAQSIELQEAQTAVQKAEEEAAQQRMEMERVRLRAEREAREKAAVEEAEREKRLAAEAEAALEALKQDHTQRASQAAQQARESRRIKAVENAQRAQEEQDRALKELQEAALVAKAVLAEEEKRLALEAEEEEEEEEGEAGGQVGPLPRISVGAQSFLSTLAVPILQELQDMCTEKEDEIFCTFYEADAKATSQLTFGKIWNDSGLLSYHLRYTWNVQKGEHVALCLDYGLAYISAWVGCLRAGVVPIVVASPLPPFDITLTKMNLILKAAAPISLILTDSVISYWKEEDQTDRDSTSRFMWPMDAPWQVVDKVPKRPNKGSLEEGVAALRASIFRRPGPATSGRSRATKARKSLFAWGEDTEAEEDATSRKSFLWSASSPLDVDAFDESTLKPNDVACLTHTSGSTGDPKVVAVTFEALYEALQMTQNDLSFVLMTGLEGCSWLPPDNHIGLILAMVCPLASGCRMHYMSSLACEESPLLWLELMSRYKICWTIAPDPSYRWLIRSFDALSDQTKAEMELNLSSLQHLLNIGEATRFDTQSKFRGVFGPYRLHKECSVTVGYTLTEHVVAASWVPGEFVFVPSTLNSAPTNWVAVARRSVLPNGVTLVVVNASTKTICKNGQVGEIWISTPCVTKMKGYHKDKKLSRKIFQCRLKGIKHKFLRTGDLGFWEIDHLYICGRKKDVMESKDGVNYYPPDIDWVVEDARPEVKPGRVACFPSIGGKVEVVFEIMNASGSQAFMAKSACRAVAKAVEDTAGIRTSSVVTVPENSIPKTSTGLVERRITKSKLLKEQIPILHDLRRRRVSSTGGRLQAKPPPNVKALIQEAKRRSSIGEKGLAHLHKAELDNIIARYVGSNFDNHSSWEELGMTSAASVPMQHDIEASLFVTVAPDCLDQYPTPAALKEHITENSGNPLMTDTLHLHLEEKSHHLSWQFTGFLQAILSLVIIVLFSLAVLPCYAAFPFLLSLEPALLLLVPIWMTTFSMIVIAAKWLVVGRYHECRLATPSYPYLAWWFVDRLVDLWEVWVGQFIINTPFLWLFYICMGAKIQPTCQLDGFIREFDLVTMGDFVSLQYFCLKCRKFKSWESYELGPMMAFRSISIGSRSKVRGMVGPGAKLGEGVHVDKQSVVPEGAAVEDQVKLAGNPAFVADEIDDVDVGEYPYWLLSGMIKSCWLLVELGIMYGIWKGAEFINDSPGDVDVGTTDYWIIFGATCILLSLLSSIVVKILLIGVRRPGRMIQCWCYHPMDWAADYHFRLVTLPYRIFAQNSRLSNFILILHGMDIDFVSKVNFESFPPSRMDLIRVRRSFVGNITLDVKSNGIFHKTIVESSSLGKFTHLAPNVKIVGATIPPLSYVREDVLQDPERLKPKYRMGHTCIMYIRETSIIINDVVALGGVLFTVVPAVLIGSAVKDFVSVGAIVPITVAVLIAQSVTWFAVFLAVQFVCCAGVGTGKRVRPYFPCLHWVYLNFSDTYQTWSFLRVIWGSPLNNWVVRFLGAKVEGRFVFLGDRLDDFRLITISDRTVLDGATIVGHNAVYDRCRFGRTKVSGLVRERTFALGGASITRKETGPWQAVARQIDLILESSPSSVRSQSFSAMDLSGSHRSGSAPRFHAPTGFDASMAVLMDTEDTAPPTVQRRGMSRNEPNVRDHLL